MKLPFLTHFNRITSIFSPKKPGSEKPVYAQFISIKLSFNLSKNKKAGHIARLVKPRIIL